MCTAVAVGVAVSGAGAGYNAYNASKQAKRANRAMDEYKDLLQDQQDVAGQQLQLYRDEYAPNIRKLGRRLNQQTPLSVSQGAPVAAGTTSALSGLDTGARVALSRGVSPGSGSFQRAITRGSTTAAMTEADIRNAAKKTADDLMFSRRLGLAQTGRGIPGEVTGGFERLADTARQQANAWGNAAANSTSSAISGLGNAALFAGML